MQNSKKESPEWRLARAETVRRIDTLRQQGVCYQCHDDATGEVFGKQAVIVEDDRFKVLLDSYPRMLGHTIVVYKPHREDISELAAEESAAVFQLCVRVVNAIKQALGAEKVYLNTMCDGAINHLHVQLLPRYPGDPLGSRRFVAPRGPLADGKALAARIGEALRP
jgi:diadenosine tetraphosphate (Ap4A) HIT family hydrolase